MEGFRIANKNEGGLFCPGMPTVAEQLHQAREARKLTIQQVAEITKLRTDHVRALEEGNYAIFPAPVYIRGFVRTYASLLKLDVPVTMAALESELGQTRKLSEPPPLSDQPRGALDVVMLQLASLDWRRALLRVGLLCGLLVVAAGVLAWRRYQHSDPLHDLKPALYQSVQGSPGETLPLPTPRH